MDPYSEAGRRNLMDWVEDSRRELAPVLENRRKLLARSAGSGWYANGASQPTPINQMAQNEEALVHHLVGGEPQALVVPGAMGLEAPAYEQTLALNKEAQRIGLRKRLQRLVRSALYGMGIARIGMTAGPEAPIREIDPELDEEGTVAAGQLTLDVISPDCWVHDCEADSMEGVEFCGHSYWVNEEDIDSYLPGISERDLLADEKTWLSEQGNETAAAISHGAEGQIGSARRQKHWLWDLWLPLEGVILTTPVNGTGEHAFVRSWDSRPGGPYLRLWYQELADQAIPKSVQADLALVHDSMNSTFNKIIEQIAAAKTLLGFKPGNADDAERVRDAGHLGMVQMRNPDGVKEFSFNGPDQAMLATFLQEREIASILGGNTDVLAGLGSQSPTLGQEEMVSSQAGVRVRAMEQDTATFLVEVFEAMRWYLFHEQFRPIPITKQFRGTDVRTPGEWSAWRADEVQGGFDAFAMQIEPYIRTYTTPEERLQKILGWWERVVLPAMQLGLIQQAPDMDRLNEIGAQYQGLPELQGILRYISESEQGKGGGGETRQSPVTTRNYVRQGAPGPSRGGLAQQAMQMMQSGGGNGQ